MVTLPPSGQLGTHVTEIRRRRGPGFLASGGFKFDTRNKHLGKPEREIFKNYNPTKTKMARWNIHHEDVYVLFPWRIHSCLAYLPTWRHIKTNRMRKYMLILGQPVFRKEASSILGVFIFNCFLDGALGCLHFCWVKLVCVGCPSFPGSFQNDTVV